jgi:MFS family permease
LGQGSRHELGREEDDDEEGPGKAREVADPDVATYRALFATRGFVRLVLSMLLGRLSTTMLQLTIILFALQRFHSPTVAGAVVFLAVAPGLVLSPIAGALLDRHGRARLVVVDYVVAAASIALIAALALADALPVAALLAIVTLTSLTNPLSAAGMRSLFPVMVPSRLWARANAIDANGYLVAAVFGPAAAGAIYAGFGPEAALFAVSVIYVAAAVSASGIADPSEQRAHGPLLREAWSGVRYVVRNRTLRALAIGVSTASAASGIYLIALPVLLLGRIGVREDVVGRLYALYGVGGFFAGLLVGRLSTIDRERRLLAMAYVINAGLILVVLFVPQLIAVAGAMLLLGAVSGPTNVVMFTLRQRRTDPQWFGRAFAVSMSMNYAGNPIGSALAGAIIPVSLEAALACAAFLYVAAGVLSAVGIPTRDDAAAS